MSCSDYVPEIDLSCREIPHRVNKIRVYKRVPRKLKKQIKKAERLAITLKLLAMAVESASLAIDSIYGIQVPESTNPYTRYYEYVKLNPPL